MTTINDTVNSALRERGYGSYVSAAQPIIDVLTDRERQISDQLLSYAQDMGADPSDVREKLAELGMVVSPNAIVEDDDDDDDMSAEPSHLDETEPTAIERIELLLNGMAERLNGLTAFARQNGYRG